MNFVLQPWQLLLAILAGWINRQQQEVIEYLRTENQILKEKLGKRRILLTDDQRRRLARKGKVLGRKVLETVGTLFTPDTILRWHRLLVAQKWDTSERQEEAWTTARRRRDPNLGGAPGKRKPDLGLRPDPGRLGQPWAHPLGCDRGQHPETARHRADPRSQTSSDG